METMENSDSVASLLNTFSFASQMTIAEFPGMIGATLFEPWFWQGEKKNYS